MNISLINDLHINDCFTTGDPLQLAISGLNIKKGTFVNTIPCNNIGCKLLLCSKKLIRMRKPSGYIETWCGRLLSMNGTACIAIKDPAPTLGPYIYQDYNDLSQFIIKPSGTFIYPTEYTPAQFYDEVEVNHTVIIRRYIFKGHPTTFGGIIRGIYSCFNRGCISYENCNQILVLESLKTKMLSLFCPLLRENTVYAIINAAEINGYLGSDKTKFTLIKEMVI